MITTAQSTSNASGGEGEMMLLRRAVVNRDGAILNESSVQVRNRIEALSCIVSDQRAFPASGYDDICDYYWARTNEREVHQWRIVE